MSHLHLLRSMHANILTVVVVAQLQNGRFRHQRSAVRIQSSATFIEPIFLVNLFVEKAKKRKKRLRIAPFEKTFLQQHKTRQTRADINLTMEAQPV